MAAGKSQRMCEMIFTAGDIDAFLAVSGDTNPLHSDYDFARMSGFDGRVVPGVLAAIAAVRDRGSLHTIRAKFAQPLYAYVDYPFGCNGRLDRFWYGGKDKRAMMWVDELVFVNRNMSQYESAQDIGDYVPKSGSMFWQHLVLHWASWMVGTRTPGHGGILAQLEIEFSDIDNPVVGGLSFATRIHWNDNLGIVTLDSVLRCGLLEAFCTITAFKPRT